MVLFFHSQVQWASPSIFYKPFSGKGEWQFLYQIPCALDGSVCSGSINTDEISPELIPISGAKFKLLQFNSLNSGVLTPAFTITAHRFADSYEFDDGDLSRFNYPNGTTDGFPINYQYDNTYSNPIALGEIQVHNFHSPSAYDSNVDVDTVQVTTNILGEFEINQGHQLTVTVSNMASGLDVDFTIECAGLGFDTNLPEPIDFEGSYGFVNSPIISNIYNPINNSRTIKFQLKKNTTINNNGHSVEIYCLYNRVVISRISGTPSESLTYNLVVNEVVQIDGPDQYDNVPNQRAYDDVQGDGASIVSGVAQTHNFHDVGDTDWTLFHTPTAQSYNYSTQNIGSNSSTTLKVYKVTSWVLNPNFPGQARFIINSKQLIASDNSGVTSVNFNSTADTSYVVETTSRTNSFGNNTEYKAKLNLQ